MKLCIISDLHCQHQDNSSGENRDTFLTSNKARVPVSQHPVASMLKVIDEKENIKSDYLLCLGDLGNKADEQGISSAWGFVGEIKEKLGAKCKVCVPGNHDVNSRRNFGKDAFTYIKSFHESFPTSDRTLNSHFWDRGFCFKTVNDVLFLMINTVHDHNSEENASDSCISEKNFEDIKQELATFNNLDIKYKICVMHHHPITYSDISYKDRSLDKGDNLMSLINENGFDIVIHGHKHIPRISEYNGMPIFGAGTFSSITNITGTGIDPMFHVIEFSEVKRKGKIYSWEYNLKDGWIENQNVKFPPVIGYGGSVDLEKSANQILELINSDGQPKLYSKVLSIIPDLEYLIPEKLTYLEKLLRNKGIAPYPKYPLQPALVTILSESNNAQ